MLSTLSSTFRELTSVPAADAGLAVGLYAASVGLAGLRWQRVLAAMGVKLTLAHTCLGTIGSIFVNNVTPASRVSGEAYRAAYACAKARIDAKAATASVALDRAIELPIVGGVFLLALPSLWPLLANTHAVIVGIVAVTTAIALVALAYRLLPRTRAFAATVRAHFVSTPIDKRQLAVAMVPGSLLWLQDLLRLQVVAHACGVHLSLQQTAVLSVLAIAGGLVPTVGGLGAVEGSLTAGLVLFGVPLSTAMAVALLERSISFVLATAVGGLAVVGLGGGWLWQQVRSPSHVIGTIPK